MALDMRAEDEETPSSWEDHSSTPPMPSSSSDLDKSTFSFQIERYAITLIVILLVSSLRSPTIGGDINLAVKRTSL
jgi:hypothetical protein